MSDIESELTAAIALLREFEPLDRDTTPAMLARAVDEIRRLRLRVESLKEFEPRILVGSSFTNVSIAVAKGFFAELVASLDKLNSECNYTVTVVSCGETRYEVMARRVDKPTEHDKRKEAEAKCAKLESDLAALRNLRVAVLEWYVQSSKGRRDSHLIDAKMICDKALADAKGTP